MRRVSFAVAAVTVSGALLTSPAAWLTPAAAASSSVAVALALAIAPDVAHAEGSRANLAQARVLGEAAADALDAKDYAGALAKATQAEGLYHAPTNLLMIAQAHEGLGELAQAADAYEALAAEVVPASAPKVFHKAKDAAKLKVLEMQRRVPSVLLKLGDGTCPNVPADRAGVTATLDGRPLPLHADAPTRVDPGTRVLKVSFAGCDPIERKVTLPEGGGVLVIEAPLQAPEAASPVTAPPPEHAPAPPDSHKGSGSHALAYAVIGVGGAAVAMGAVTGALSLAQVGSLKTKCPGNVCPAGDQSKVSSAKTLGTVSTVGLGVGLPVAACGLALFFLLGRGTSHDAPPSSDKAPEKATSGVTVTPYVGLGSVGALGRF